MSNWIEALKKLPEHEQQVVVEFTLGEDIIRAVGHLDYSSGWVFNHEAWEAGGDWEVIRWLKLPD